MKETSYQQEPERERKKKNKKLEKTEQSRKAINTTQRNEIEINECTKRKIKPRDNHIRKKKRRRCDLTETPLRADDPPVINKNIQSHYYLTSTSNHTYLRPHVYGWGRGPRCHSQVGAMGERREQKKCNAHTKEYVSNYLCNGIRHGASPFPGKSRCLCSSAPKSAGLRSTSGLSHGASSSIVREQQKLCQRLDDREVNSYARLGNGQVRNMFKSTPNMVNVEGTLREAKKPALREHVSKCG